jgi:hypothetical protein
MSAIGDAVNKAATLKIAEIIASDCPDSIKYIQLDQLLLRVMEQHPDGWASDTVRVIQAAQTRVMYAGKN